MSHYKAGYLRETVHEAGFNVVYILEDEIVLEDMETKNLELWAVSDNFAGYAIEFNGHEYEFIRTIS